MYEVIPDSTSNASIFFQKISYKKPIYDEYLKYIQLDFKHVMKANYVCLTKTINL